MATASSGTVGNSWCVVRIIRESTVASPIPASKIRSDGGVGRSWESSSADRLTTTAFSLQVLTNVRYFWRLS